MSPARRIIILTVALALTVCGWGLVADLLLFAPGWKGILVLGGGFVGCLGMFWLWEDFICAKS